MVIKFEVTCRDDPLDLKTEGVNLRLDNGQREDAALVVEKPERLAVLMELCVPW